MPDPSDSACGSRTLRKLALACTGALLVAIAAQASLPIGPVPITLQTAMMFMIAALFGARIGCITACIYLLAAWLGAPVLHDFESFGGTGLIAAKTAGYVIAFAPASAAIGILTRSGSRDRIIAMTTIMLAAHALVLIIGAAWLATHVGLRQAWMHGVAPFWIGALLKSIGVAAIVCGLRRSWPSLLTRSTAAPNKTT